MRLKITPIPSSFESLSVVINRDRLFRLIVFGCANTKCIVSELVFLRRFLAQYMCVNFFLSHLATICILCVRDDENILFEFEWEFVVCEKIAMIVLVKCS